MRDRHVRVGIEALLLVSRGAILIARHPEQRQDNDEPQAPSDETQHDPAKGDHESIRRVEANPDSRLLVAATRARNDQPEGVS